MKIKLAFNLNLDSELCAHLQLGQPGAVLLCLLRAPHLHSHLPVGHSLSLGEAIELVETCVEPTLSLIAFNR